MKRMRISRLLWVGVVGLLAAACVPEGFRLPQSPLLGALEQKSGLIAYVGLDGNIHTIDQGGGQQIAITDDADIEAGDGTVHFYDSPTWELNGDRLAFQRLSIEGVDGQSASQSVRLYTSPGTGGGATEIYSSRDDFPFYLYWSPDGELVSFLTASAGGGPYALQVVSSEGGDVSVVDTGAPYYWAWSPRDQQLLAHVGGASQINPNEARLSLLTVGPTVREVGLSVEPSFFQAPAYSPDGSFIVFAAHAGEGRHELVVADSEGQARTPLATIEGAVAFDWSPMGDRVAYVDYITDEGRPQRLIGRLNFFDVSDVRDPIPVSTNAESVFAFFWAPNGEQVAYFVPEPRVVQTGGDEAGGETTTSTELFLRLFIADAQSGETRELTSFRPTQQFVNILSFYDQYQRSATIWSPDSTNLVISALQGSGAPGIFIVPASGRLGERYLADGLLAFWSWR